MTGYKISVPDWRATPVTRRARILERRSSAGATPGIPAAETSRHDWKTHDWKAMLRGFAILLLVYAAVVYAIPKPPTIKPEGWRLTGLFVTTIVGQMVEPIPGRRDRSTFSHHRFPHWRSDHRAGARGLRRQNGLAGARRFLRLPRPAQNLPSPPHRAVFRSTVREELVGRLLRARHVGLRAGESNSFQWCKDRRRDPSYRAVPFGNLWIRAGTHRGSVWRLPYGGTLSERLRHFGHVLYGSGEQCARGPSCGRTRLSGHLGKLV
jgi:hypothetical protein